MRLNKIFSKKAQAPLEITAQAYTYVIRNQKDNRWYTGTTTDLRKRFQEHNDNKVISTKNRGPFEIIYYEACRDMNDALARERYLKTGMGKRYLKNRMKRFLSLTGQATAEIALFGTLILLVLGALFSYTRSIRDQQFLEQQAFRTALATARDNPYQVKDVEGEWQTNYGATLSFNMNRDTKTALLFGSPRRSSAASSTVLWSGGYDTPDLNQMQVNQDEVALSRKTLQVVRDLDAGNSPYDEELLKTIDMIASIAPSVTSLLFSIPGFPEAIGIAASAAPVIGFVLRTWQMEWFIYEYYGITKPAFDAAQERNEALEDQDEQYSRWGWRVATEEKDGADKAGKYYMKDIDAQPYDTRVASNTISAYTENRDETMLSTINDRSVTVTDTLNYNYKLRYDVTSPDPTIPPELHTYEYVQNDPALADINLQQGLHKDTQGNLVYDSATAGTPVTEGEIWTTPK